MGTVATKSELHRWGISGASDSASFIKPLARVNSIATQQAPASRNQKRAQECLYDLSASWASGGGIAAGRASFSEAGLSSLKVSSAGSGVVGGVAAWRLWGASVSPIRASHLPGRV